jgi:signal transduction histidine kinase
MAERSLRVLKTPGSRRALPIIGAILIAGTVFFCAHRRESSLTIYDAQSLPEFSTFELTGAAGFLGGCAVVLLRSGNKRHSAVLFLLAACLVPLALEAPSYQPEPPRAAAALGLAFLVVAGVLALTYPGRNLPPPYRPVVAVLSAGLIVVPAMLQVPGVGARVPAAAGTAIEIAAMGVLIAAVLARQHATRGLRRQALTPLAVITVALALVSAAVVVLSHWPAPPWENPLWQYVVALNVQGVVLALIPLAVLAEALRRRWAVAAVYEQVGRALGDRDPAILVTALRKCLRDPGLAVWLAGRSENDWFDAAQPAGSMPGPLPPVSAGRRRLAVVDADGTPLGMLDVEAGQGEERPLLDAVLSAMRVGLENASLDARIRRHNADLESSRRRIVEAISRQRIDLRRELVEGPRKELELVREGLAEAREGLTATPDSRAGARPARIRIADARTHLGRGLAGVREVARGVYPALLTQSGLVAALEALREQAGIAVDLHVELAVPDARIRGAVESTAYFVVADCLDRAEKSGASRCRADLRTSGRHLHIEVTYATSDRPENGAIAQLQAAEDRVEALGGTFSAVARTGPGHGLDVHARIPLVDGET